MGAFLGSISLTLSKNSPKAAQPDTPSLAHSGPALLFASAVSRALCVQILFLFLFLLWAPCLRKQKRTCREPTQDTILCPCYSLASSSG